MIRTDLVTGGLNRSLSMMCYVMDDTVWPRFLAFSVDRRRRMLAQSGKHGTRLHMEHANPPV